MPKLSNDVTFCQSFFDGKLDLVKYVSTDYIWEDENADTYLNCNFRTRYIGMKNINNHTKSYLNYLFSWEIYFFNSESSIPPSLIKLIDKNNIFPWKILFH